MITRYLIPFIFLFCACKSKPIPSVLQNVAQISEVENRQLAANRFVDSISSQGAPIVRGDSLFYLFQGDVKQVALTGDIVGWNDQGIPFRRIKETNLWYLGQKVLPKSYLEYKLIVDNGEWIIDPLNPDSTVETEYVNSVIRLPGFEDSQETAYRPDIPHGKLDSNRIMSALFDTTFSYKIYTPPNYEVDSLERYPVAYFHDGGANVKIAKVPNIIDLLIHENKMRPIIAVFVEPNERNAEYAYNRQGDFIQFMSTELLPYIDASFRTIPKAEARATIGASFGGLISAKLAFREPVVFGNCGAHSASYWVDNEQPVEMLREKMNLPIKYAAIWGSYERGIKNPNDKVKEAFLDVDREMYWKELPFGHSWYLWRATTDDFLIYFFPPIL